MKFENIKVDDTVFIEESVKYGFNKEESFFIPNKVVRVTKTQFLIENGDKYRKDNGSRMGNYYFKNAYYKGDVYSSFNDRIVSDETKQKKEFEYKIGIERKINNEIVELKLPLNSELTIQELIGIALHIEEIKKIINK